MINFMARIADQAVVFDLADLGAVWAEIEISTVEVDDGLPRRPVEPVLGYGRSAFWHLRVSYPENSKRYLPFCASGKGPALPTSAGS